MKLTPEFIRLVNQMQRIQDALFADGNQQMRLHYTLKPVPSANIQSITADIDGNSFTSTASQAQAKQMVWPGPPGAQQVMIRVKAGANIPFASYEGLWSVFRMMADADPRPPGSKMVELSKVRRGHGRPRRFSIRTTSQLSFASRFPTCRTAWTSLTGTFSLSGAPEGLRSNQAQWKRLGVIGSSPNSDAAEAASSTRR